MANLPENFGVECLLEADTAMSFLAYLAKNGKAIIGYYGEPYLYTFLGDLEYWAKIEKNDENELELTELDFHCGGKCIWNMTCSGIDITPKDTPKLKKVLMFNRVNEIEGLLPVDLITADVLPSYMEEDQVAVQIIGLLLEINYYANEEDYEAAQPTDKDGKKWMAACGSLLPLQFLINHQVERGEQEADDVSDAYVHFAATVTEIYTGVFELNGEKNVTFLRCNVDTKYGPLELEHTIEQVPEQQRRNIKVGSIVSGVCVLSGDVAIYEYEKGAVKDLQHDLMLLRYTFTKGDPERLRSVLMADAVYETDTSGESFRGVDCIIERLKVVQEARKDEYSAYLATLTKTDEEHEYPAGTRCIALSTDEGEHYESIAFIDVNQDGKIERIKVSKDERYRFQLDDRYVLRGHSRASGFPKNV